MEGTHQGEWIGHAIQQSTEHHSSDTADRHKPNRDDQSYDSVNHPTHPQNPDSSVWNFGNNFARGHAALQPVSRLGAVYHEINLIMETWRHVRGRARGLGYLEGDTFRRIYARE
jgi:hypothetical protein